MIQVTCALIILEDKILITQNGENSDHAYQWEFPGGKIKKDESPQECIIREIWEELELKIELKKTLKSVEHVYPKKQILLIPFICEIESGTIKLNHHIAFEWIKLSDLEDVDFSEADKRMLEIAENRSQLEKYTRK